MKALIDGDSLVYTIGFACQKDVYQAVEVLDAETGEVIVHEEFPSKTACLTFIETPPASLKGIELVVGKRIIVSPPQHAFHTIKIVIQKICQAAKADTYKVYLTGKQNFREALATQMGYKHNRINKPKPELYQAIRDYLQQIHRAQMIHGMEADDALAISFTMSQDKSKPINTSKDPNVPVWRWPEDAIICAIDKDLRTVPGKQINFSKHVANEDGSYKAIFVTEPEARYNFWTQVLTGDTSDNVLGLPKCGPKIAAKILEGAQTEVEYFDRVYAAYRKFYGEEWFDYYHWQAYVDSTAAYSKRQLRPIEELEAHPEWKLKGHAITMLLENARLLWMLRKPINQDGSHWWMPPKSFEEIMASPSKPTSEPGPVPEAPPPEVAAPTPPVTLAAQNSAAPPRPGEYNEEGGVLSPLVKEKRDADRARFDALMVLGIFERSFAL